MRYGFVLPGGSAREQVEQAVVAERAGWDGVFVFEIAYGVDAWSLLAAMALRTARVRLGTMLTPLPWRRPWKVASQVATVDELSGGRAVLTVGLGAPGLGEWGEVSDRRERAQLLDEGIDLIDTIWSGGPVYSGQRHRIDFSSRTDMFAGVRPVQRPRVPIWVVGAWPRPASMRRVLRCDGVVPYYLPREEGEPRSLEPGDLPALVAWLDGHGGRRPGFDVIVEGETPADGAAAAEIVRPWADAGATWWLDARWTVPAADRDRVVRERLEAGPPRV